MNLRMAVNEVWNTVPGAFCMFGICCNSFTRMPLGLLLSLSLCNIMHAIDMQKNIWYAPTKIRSSHTSGRDVLNDYLGNDGYEFVRIGNLLASRLILLLILCSCRGCRWLVEQPEGSSLPNTPRFQQFLSMTKVSWNYFIFLCVCVYSFMHAAFCNRAICIY